MTCNATSADVDPSAPSSVTYDWSCVSQDPDGCFGADGQPLAFEQGQPRQRLVPMGSANGIKYEITCAATMAGQTASATGHLIAKNAPLPTVSIAALGVEKVNPGAKLVLQGSASAGGAAGAAGALQLQWRWARKDDPTVDLTDSSVRSAPPFSSHPTRHKQRASFSRNLWRF